MNITYALYSFTLTTMTTPSSTSTTDPLLELLLPHMPPTAPPPDPTTSSTYLTRLSSLSLTSILETEPSSLSASLHSLTLNLQKLSSRSHKQLIASSHHLSSVPEAITSLNTSLDTLTTTLPTVDDQITHFTTTFTRDGPHLTTRASTHLLSRNLDRILDILHLPTHLQTLIASSSHPTALDLLAHVRRLHALHPNSPTISSVATACASLQQTMVTNLITTLRGPLKLPTAMKTIGFLRRCTSGQTLDERGLRGLFLVCRAAYLSSLLDALEPLKELATGAAGKERYLKRWIEVFREQSFAIVGMYRSIFPNSLPAESTAATSASPTISSPPTFTSRTETLRSRSSSTLSSARDEDDPEGGQPPDPLASFVLHLVGLLTGVLGEYLSGVEDKAGRESLLTQVLYAAGSLGRLGGEFGAMLGVVECFGGGGGGGEGEEWVGVVAKHKVLAGRLETLAGRT